MASLASSRVRLDVALVTFTGGALCGALLLFMLEPMFVKMALPRLGGASDVWTACVLAYQCMLLAGYAYAHALLRLPSVRAQVAVHGVLTVAALAMLPPAIPAGWHPGDRAPAAVWLILALLRTIGLPFFVLSATSPLLSAWFTHVRPARDPYALYAASNTGSLVALAAYPFAVEPLLGLHAQGVLWSAGYAVFVASIAGCALIAGQAAATSAGRAAVPAALPAARIARWLLLGFVPSSVMLSCTAYLSERVAPIPLLWTLPLGIYLASFIVVFGARPERVVAAANRALPLLLAPLLFVLCMHGALPPLFEVPLHALVFAAVALVCHGALAADRPAPAQLTAFYLVVAAGGVLGGLFNSVIAPLVFPDVYEYGFGLVLACFALRARDAAVKLRADTLVPLVMLGATVMAFAIASHAPPGRAEWIVKVTIALAAVACFACAARPLRMGLTIAVLLTVAEIRAHSGDLALERNFYGIKRVYATPAGVHGITHGHTLHGAEVMTARDERTPQTYYTRGGPLGDIFRAQAARPAVAVIGLGAGSTACYRRPGDDWTFYEIDPGMVAIARDRALFRYLADCAPRSPIVIGDARVSLAAEPHDRFDLMLFDAYASDAIPTHLLTREAVALYLARLRPHGRLVFHISNAYFDFAPLVATLGADAGLVARVRLDARSGAAEPAYLPSRWMVLARSSADLGSLAHDVRWSVPHPSGRIWTDDYSSIVTLLHVPG